MRRRPKASPGRDIRRGFKDSVRGRLWLRSDRGKVMEDLILLSRLDTLEQNLAQLVDNPTWLKECFLRPFAFQHAGVSVELWPEAVWIEFDSTVRTHARSLKLELRKIRKTLRVAGAKPGEEALQDIKESWGRYQDIYEQSQEVFGECLEYVGGLALRDRGFDQKICHVADKLILSCAEDWNNLKWQSLTVLTAQEKLGQTLARIIRLRFPEWTIWTLPFTAHEFGHVAIHAIEPLREFVEGKINELMRKDPQLEAARATHPPASQIDLASAESRARKRAENHIYKLVADAFATYTMGPAYPCAALLLRFNPVTAGSGEHEHPTDVKRAELVLSMLGRMNENEEAAGDPPYTNIIDRLQREWATACERARPSSGPSAPAGRARLEDLIDVDDLAREALEVFWNRIREVARYPHEDSEHGWLKARDWQAKIMANLKNAADPVADIKVTRTSKLRDALNAAWLCRIYDGTDNIRKISAAALTLCEAIIKKADGGSAAPTPGYSLTGGVGVVPPAQDTFR